MLFLNFVFTGPEMGDLNKIVIPTYWKELPMFCIAKLILLKVLMKHAKEIQRNAAKSFSKSCEQ